MHPNTNAQSQLKYACATSLIATLICLSGSYLHMQLMSKFTSFYKKFQSLSQDHLIIIFGSSSTSLSAHQIHKMLPANPLLDSGISKPSILQVISNSLSYTLALFNPSTRSVFLSQVAAHHKTNPNLSSQVNLIPYNPLPLHTSCMVIRFPHHWFRSSCINIQLAWITNIWDKTSRPHILTPHLGMYSNRITLIQSLLS